MNKKNRPMNGQILNGSGQGLRRFKLVNGRRHWIDQPTVEWQEFEKKPSRPNKNYKQPTFFKNHD
jgi:hypothetical protein